MRESSESAWIRAVLLWDCRAIWHGSRFIGEELEVGSEVTRCGDG